MTPDDTPKRKDPGVAKTAAEAQAVARSLTAMNSPAMQVNPFAQLQGIHPYWQQNLGMTTQVLPGVAGAQTFNAAALSASMPDLYTSTHRQ